VPRNVYSEINLHITWHVKDDAPVLTETIEGRVHRFLKGRALQTPGLFWHESGGTDDHVHVVVSVPAALNISDWIGELKGSSSHCVNHEVVNRKVLHWQTGYGVVSFGTRDLPWVVDYVRRQREHHAAGAAQGRLERTESEDQGKPAEAG